MHTVLCTCGMNDLNIAIKMVSIIMGFMGLHCVNYNFLCAGMFTFMVQLLVLVQIIIIIACILAQLDTCIHHVDFN